MVSSHQGLHQLKKKSWLTKILGPTVGETSTGTRLTPVQAIIKEFDQYLHYPKKQIPWSGGSYIINSFHYFVSWLVATYVFVQ